jgi:nicotinamide riboside kinase
MKVIISGAQCVGKTTLINDIPDEFKSMIIKEQIRELVNTYGVKHDLETNDESQMMFFDIYNDIFNQRKDYISDRGMLDVVAYTKYFVLTGNCSNDTYQTMLERFKKIDKDGVHYVYIPIEFPATEDGFRNTKEEYRKGVNRCLCEVMSECGIEPYVVKGGMLARQTYFNNLLYSVKYHENI